MWKDVDFFVYECTCDLYEVYISNDSNAIFCNKTGMLKLQISIFMQKSIKKHTAVCVAHGESIKYRMIYKIISLK